MSDFYDESVRPWLPECLGGYKCVEADESGDQESEASADNERGLEATEERALEGCRRAGNASSVVLRFDERAQ